MYVLHHLSLYLQQKVVNTWAWYPLNCDREKSPYAPSGIFNLQGEHTSAFFDGNVECLSMLYFFYFPLAS